MQLFTMGGIVLPLVLFMLWVMEVKGQNRIIYVSKYLTWTDAQTYCRQHHIDLVTITTEAENDQINEDSWLGLYRQNSSAEWKWSRGDIPLTFCAWNENAPVQRKDSNCACKRTIGKGSWTNVKCSETHKFFCLDDSLFLVRQLKTWEEALVHCRSLSSGDRRYDLASLITDEDHDYVKNQTSNKVWTGLRYLGDRWVWVGGEEVQYDGIRSCPVYRRCGSLDKTSSAPYSNTNCEKKRHFFCYRKYPVVDCRVTQI